MYLQFTWEDGWYFGHLFSSELRNKNERCCILSGMLTALYVVPKSVEVSWVFLTAL
jgi:hypothetical protein